MIDEIRPEELEWRWKVAKANFQFYLDCIYAGEHFDHLVREIKDLGTYVKQLATLAKEVEKINLADEIGSISESEMKPQLTKLEHVVANKKAIQNMLEQRRSVDNANAYNQYSTLVAQHIEKVGQLTGKESGIYNLLVSRTARADLADSGIQDRLGLIMLPKPTAQYTQLEERLYQHLFEDTPIYSGLRPSGGYGRWDDTDRSIDARKKAEEVSLVARRFDNPERIMELFIELCEDNARLKEQGKEGIFFLDSALIEYATYAYRIRGQRPPEETLREAFHPDYGIKDKGVEADFNISIAQCHHYTLIYLARGFDLKTAQANSVGSAKGLMNMAKMVASGPDWPERYAKSEIPKQQIVEGAIEWQNPINN